MSGFGFLEGNVLRPFDFIFSLILFSSVKKKKKRKGEFFFFSIKSGVWFSSSEDLFYVAILNSDWDLHWYQSTVDGNQQRTDWTTRTRPWNLTRQHAKNGMRMADKFQQLELTMAQLSSTFLLSNPDMTKSQKLPSWRSQSWGGGTD